LSFVGRRAGITAGGHSGGCTWSADIRDHAIGHEVVVPPLSIDKVQDDLIAVYFGAGLAVIFELVPVIACFIGSMAGGGLFGGSF